MKQFSIIVLLVLGSLHLALAQSSETRKVLFFGDSITAGYGLENGQAFPALIQQKIDSLGWNYEVVNAGLSGETSAGGLRRVDWILRQDVDVFVLELGGNDGLRGIDLRSTKTNLQAIIDKVRETSPETKIILAGMQVPPNLGQDYTSQFREMYPELARNNDVTLIPFILEGVGGNPEYNQGDGIHPNAKGHKILAENTWKVLEPMLQEMR